jgi:EAL domain-containing protein (putative c-di-GMP-specific phosphodiesterase class I)
MAPTAKPLFGQRLRHGLWALLIALFVGATALLEPAEVVLWQAKPKVRSQAPSGDIVFIPIRTQGSSAERKEILAHLLTRLDRETPGNVFVNMQFHEPDPDADRLLSQAIRDFPGDLRFVSNVSDSYSVNPGIARKGADVYASRYVRYFGYTQWMDYSYVVGGRRVPSLPVLMAGTGTGRDGRFYIDYTFRYDQIPTVPARDLLAGTVDSRISLTGKSIIIGSPDDGDALSSIPGQIGAAPSYIYIYAAETLKAGIPRYFGWLPALLACALCIMTGIVQHRSRRRRDLAYALAGVAFAAAVAVCLATSIVLEVAPAAAMLAVFSGLRLWAWKARVELRKDTTSGLPNFRALGEDLKIAGGVSETAIVIAKIGHFNELIAVLTKAQARQYTNHVARVISVSIGNLPVYCEGRYFAFVLTRPMAEEVIQHCEGLRALCEPGWSGLGATADILMTFGIDRSHENDPERKIASAVAAAERSGENTNPIAFASLEEKTSKSFEISIQSHIDAALLKQHISVVYQAQLGLDSGRLVGAEALVRWHDPQRGNISPAFFIQQCEDNGRLGALTEHVFRNSLATLKQVRADGTAMQMSLNVSATQLRNYQMVDLLKKCIADAGVNAADITIEVTETAKIQDYAVAERVLTSIRDLGVGISVDDFGVGMTNLETLLRLPFDELKVDRLFVSAVTRDEKARMLTQWVINLGQAAGMSVVAEGVEDVETLNCLRRMSCDIAQGYYISRPIPKDDFLDFQRTYTTKSDPIRTIG